MKKFLVGATILFFILLVVNKNMITKLKIDIENVFYNGSGAVENIVIKDGEVYIKKGDRKNIALEKLIINGINIDPSKPGTFPKSNLVTEEEYLRWFNYIQEIKVNCIRVNSLMGRSFYSALKKFNTNNESPLYILQGIYFNEEVFKRGENLKEKEVLKKFKVEIKKNISAIHGDVIKEHYVELDNLYKEDISKYVIGYTIGSQWAAHDIIYENIVNEAVGFSGKYFKTVEGASPFEEYICYLANYAVDYEMKEYREQKLISFVCQGYNYLRGKEERKISEGTIIPLGAIEGNKRVRDYIDLNNIVKTKNYKETMIASFNIYPDIREDFNYNKSVGEYINRLKAYCNLPIIISEFGMPTGRNTYTDYGESKNVITEKLQGDILVKVHKEITNSNILGGFIFELQDSWYKSSFNTAKNRILDRMAYWSDRETEAQFYGVLSFDPVKSDDNKSLISNGDSFQLFKNTDERYLHLIIKGDGLTELNKYYIDLDITPKSGSIVSSEYGLKFESPVDFIIKIDGEDGGEVLVQKYYSIFDFDTSIKRLKLRPNTVSVTKDMDQFVKIKLLTREKVYIAESDSFVSEEYAPIGSLNKMEFNKDGFIESGEFSFNGNELNIRIPWGLLNFRDPSTSAIEDDFYENFSFRSLNIDKIGVGVTIKGINGEVKERLSSKEINLTGWEIPSFKERLKESYYIFKEYKK